MCYSSGKLPQKAAIPHILCDRCRGGFEGEDMLYRKDRKGNDISQLGYGCMRFSKKGGSIDLDKTEKELMRAVEAGVN